MKKYLLLLTVMLSGCAQMAQMIDQSEAEMFSEQRDQDQEQLEKGQEQLEKSQKLLDKERELLIKEQELLEKEQTQVAREQALLKKEVTQVSGHTSGIDPVSEAVAQMAAQMNAGLLENRVRRFPIAIVPFVNLQDQKTVGAFGERLSESFLYQIQQHGYNVVDYRAVSLNTTTKQPLSKQNLSALRVRHKIYFILTGTYAQHPDGLVLNARVLDTTTRQVLASGQTHIVNERLEGALPGYDPLQSLNKGFIIENGSGPVSR